MSRADRFLNACRRQPVDCTPVWMMRQAGRYLPEYREIRAKHTFLEMCKTPELAAEVTVQPVRRYEIDAAIIFADILLPLEPMGIGLEFAKGEGPVIHNPVRTLADVQKLKPIDSARQIDYLMTAIKLVQKELNGKVPLIGFSGAPFTLASYMIEGGGSRNYEHAKTMMFAEPKAWHKLMEHLTGVIINYLERPDRRGRAGGPALRLLGRRPRTNRLPRVRPASPEERDRRRQERPCRSSTLPTAHRIFLKWWPRPAET